jgi:hypothetical protein
MRLRRNSTKPVGCSVNKDGAIALTHKYTLCVCRSESSGWVEARDGFTVCSW